MCKGKVRGIKYFTYACVWACQKTVLNLNVGPCLPPCLRQHLLFTAEYHRLAGLHASGISVFLGWVQ